MRRTCFETILKLQKKNKKIIFIGSDLGPGFMAHSKDKVPEDWHRKQTLTQAERYITEELKEYESKILGADEKILQLETQLFNDLVLEDGYTNLFYFPIFKEFLKSIAIEKN